MENVFQSNGVYAIIGPDASQKKCLVLDVTNLSDKAISAIANVYEAWAGVPMSTASVEVASVQPAAAEMDDEDDEAVPGPDKSRAATNVYEKLRADNERILAEGGQIADTGWTKESLRLALDQLPAVQKRVVMKAVENGGQISRAETYQVAQFPPNRSLKGFTRPVAGVMSQLREKGDLPESADALLSTIYDASIKTYQPVQGFKVPLEVVRILRA